LTDPGFAAKFTVGSGPTYANGRSERETATDLDARLTWPAPHVHA
jgi:hypothetical protein